MENLRAKLTVEIHCPSCGSRNFFLLLHAPAPDTKHVCAECKESFTVHYRIKPTGAKVGYRYLELTLDKWFKEFSLVFGKLSGTDIEVVSPKETIKPLVAPEDEQGSLVEAVAQAVQEPTEDPGRLTHYRKGTGAGVDEIAELLRNDPGNRQLKEWLAFALYTNDMLDDAISTYLELIEDQDADPISHYYLANCYFKRGYPEAAREEWLRVVELAPESHLAEKANERIRNPRM
jgi:tetratricopeptide (TPR) repeat protein